MLPYSALPLPPPRVASRARLLAAAAAYGAAGAPDLSDCPGINQSVCISRPWLAHRAASRARLDLRQPAARRGNKVSAACPLHVGLCKNIRFAATRVRAMH